ncbi:MAG TPA: dihydrodipicolinate synthase family protein [Streptosporangiaceae bacterium]|nr:dihydrodipicolinate synthase family protein [Streptosporangiaceae bacterium]
MTQLFSGVGVALVTLFTESSEIDADATARLAAELAGRGMRAVLVAGTTGEAAKLTPTERTTLIAAVRAAVPAGIPVLAGTGAADTDASVALTADAIAAGADAALAFPPPLTDPAELGAYFGAVAKAADGRPVLAYHIPWISSPGIPVDQLGSLPIIGVKDSSGSPDRLLDELAHYAGSTYVGSSALLALAGPMGGAGAILAIANLEPEKSAAAFAGDGAAQLELAGTHLAVRAGGPARLKQMMASRGGYPATSRL